MRILHTAYSYAPLLDGVAEVVRHISEGLARRGHEVHVATNIVPSLPAESVQNGVHVHRFSVYGNFTIGIAGKAREYRELVGTGQWDIMVNHCLRSWPTDAVLEDVQRFPWPSILVTHGLGTGQPAFADYYRKVPRFIPHYAAWVTVSALNEEFGFARQHELADPIVIRNGVDLQEWDNPRIGVRQKWHGDGRPWLVNVSNHSRQKGHEWLFQLARRVRGTGARLTIVGNVRRAGKWRLGKLGVNGGCFYQCRMRSLASKSIELKVGIPRSEVVSAIREADVLVSTSRWEANSVVLLESMAAGTPWVSFDVGSARENAGGIVVDTLHQMTDAVVELLQNPDLRISLGQQGHLRARERHDWQFIVTQYEDLYRQVKEKWEPRLCAARS
jgi:glycosyltransferase involved in cell wall biosynthesis